MATNTNSAGDRVVDGPAPSRLPAEELESSFRNPGSRRRTKTGCLTCRRRRIKCGEERPICRNCVKSKRHCEGYNPRPPWRPQVIDFQHLQNGAASITFPAATLGVDFETNTSGIIYGMDPLHDPRMQHMAYPNSYAMQGQMLDQHGQPANHGYAVMPPSGQYGAPSDWQGQHFMHPRMQQAPPGASMQPHDGFHPGQAVQCPGMQYQQTPHDTSMQPMAHSNTPVPSANNSSWVLARQQQPVAYGPGAPVNGAAHPTPVLDGDWQTHSPQSGPSPTHANFATLHSPERHATGSYSPENAANLFNAQAYSDNMHQNHWSAVPHNVHDFAAPTAVPHTSEDFVAVPATRADTGQDFKPYSTRSDSHAAPLTPEVAPNISLLEQAAVQYQDDDYYDFSSSDEREPTILSGGQDEETALAQICQIGQLRLTDGLGFGDGLSDGVVDAYRPERVANPLRNPATARVYTHFVQVTGPQLSSQHRRAPPHLERRKVPFSKRGLWTHTVPLIALNEQGLLQALLALSSLQMAGMHGESTMPSYKHYAFALKRVHQAVSKPEKRHTIPVVAASLLLSIYELWCADHKMWNSHLAGAGQLLVEIDFVGQQRESIKLKAEQSKEHARGYPTLRAAKASGNIPFALKQEAKQFQELEQVPLVDPLALSKVAGRAVDFGARGQVLDEHADHSPPKYTLDVPAFEVQKDLFWAYCRQDAIGCLVSGNPLIMPYDRWTDCPPRGPISAPDGNSLGVHDHLFLLLGRIGDFNIRDRKRKLRISASSQGRGQPMASMQARTQGQTGGPPNASAAHQSPPAAKAAPQPAAPHFFGIAPTGPNAPMPSSYNIGNKDFMPDSPEAIGDLAMATEHAIEDWTEIEQTLSFIESKLHADFQPVPPPNGLITETPFGPDIYYKNLDIATAWVWLYTIRINLRRVHPSFPPHHHVAAGFGAATNAPIVQTIGRIIGGIMASSHDQASIELCGALTDVCVPIFVMGIQVMVNPQRDWLLGVLARLEIGRAYGTAGAIARGLNTAWMAAAKGGRGPPWEAKMARAYVQA